jgi:ABC-type Na+ efflux pump permease subunit
MQDKWKSRTFWIAIIWTAYVPLGMFISAYLASLGQGATFMNQLIVASGAIVTAYVGKRAVDNGTYNMGKGKKTEEK